VGVNASLPAAPIVWHDLECGGYTADLGLWRRLADAHPGAVVEIGAGTGRVSLDLARAGHGVIAVDSDPLLVAELAQRARGLPVAAVCADARELNLDTRDVSLCLVPMQTIQLLGGPAGRERFFSAAREHLRDGGILACAIAEDLDPFDTDGPQPAPDLTRIGDTLNVSQPTAVRVGAQQVLLERRREIHGPDGDPTRELDVIALDLLTRRGLEREGAAAGFRRVRARLIPATNLHVASTVVMLGG
jgi:SAM-dependent methyltransferase